MNTLARNSTCVRGVSWSAAMTLLVVLILPESVTGQTTDAVPDAEAAATAHWTSTLPAADATTSTDLPGPPTALTADELSVCQQLGIDADRVGRLQNQPLYEFTESDVDLYLRFLQATESDLRQRVARLARKNIDQPYEIYLLGEMPFEHYDPQPIYCLSKSDCLVFTEHTYAMALGHNWSSFMRLLQRIRYRDGRIGVVTRNHYTEADWNPSNRWLVRDITAEIPGGQPVAFQQTIDRAKFLRNRYELSVEIPVEVHRDVYLPWESVDLAKPHLQDGDFVNVVRGVVGPQAEANATFGGSAWVGHVGLIVRGSGGQVNLIHSAKPAVREELLDDYIAGATRDLALRDAAGKARLLGFKFLRLEEEPLRNLREIDGPHAPQIQLPPMGSLEGQGTD